MEDIVSERGVGYEGNGQQRQETHVKPAVLVLRGTEMKQGTESNSLQSRPQANTLLAKLSHIVWTCFQSPTLEPLEVGDYWSDNSIQGSAEGRQERRLLGLILSQGSEQCGS